MWGSHWPEGGLDVSILGSPESETVHMAPALSQGIQQRYKGGGLLSMMGSFNDLCLGALLVSTLPRLRLLSQAEYLPVHSCLVSLLLLKSI